VMADPDKPQAGAGQPILLHRSRDDTWP
jgi:hypothetical protein